MPDWPAAELLRTPRLVLEPLRVEHAAEMAGVLGDPALYVHMGGTPPSEAELRERYRRQVAGASPGGREGWLNWILRPDSGSAPVGVLQATVRRQARGARAELAWIVAPSHQGAGLATEAGRAVVAWLVGHGVSSFEAHIPPGHSASEAVARHLGMRATSEGRHGEVRWLTPGRNAGSVPRT